MASLSASAHACALERCASAASRSKRSGQSREEHSIPSHSTPFAKPPLLPIAADAAAAATVPRPELPAPPPLPPLPPTQARHTSRMARTRSAAQRCLLRTMRRLCRGEGERSDMEHEVTNRTLYSEKEAWLEGSGGRGKGRRRTLRSTQRTRKHQPSLHVVRATRA